MLPVNFHSNWTFFFVRKHSGSVWKRWLGPSPISKWMTNIFPCSSSSQANYPYLKYYNPQWSHKCGRNFCHLCVCNRLNCIGFWLALFTCRCERKLFVGLALFWMRHVCKERCVILHLMIHLLVWPYRYLRLCAFSATSCFKSPLWKGRTVFGVPDNSKKTIFFYVICNRLFIHVLLVRKSKCVFNESFRNSFKKYSHHKCLTLRLCGGRLSPAPWRVYSWTLRIRFQHVFKKKKKKGKKVWLVHWAGSCTALTSGALSVPGCPCCTQECVSGATPESPVHYARPRTTSAHKLQIHKRWPCKHLYASLKTRLKKSAVEDACKLRPKQGPRLFFNKRLRSNVFKRVLLVTHLTTRMLS